MGYYSSKLFYTREYKLQPFVAPDDFDRSAQAIDIFEKFKSLHQEDETAAAIWYYDRPSGLFLDTKTNFTWRYGETINGTEVISPKITSGNAFTSGSTKRWVCAYYTGTGTISLDIRYWWATWIYVYSDKFGGFLTPNSNILKYIHFHNLNNLELRYSNLFQYNSGLTGTLHLPSSLSSIRSYTFYGASAITKVNCYRMTAPTTGTDALVLGGTPRPLHVPVGSSGYNVTPWKECFHFCNSVYLNIPSF